MLLAELNIGKRSSKKGIEWALWLYGSMALWLYGSMALRKRSKNIFIASKLRLMQLFQIVENRKTKNYSVHQNSAERGYLLSTASGNLVRNGYKAIAEDGNRHCFVAYYLFICYVTTSGYLPFCIKEWKERKLF